VKILNFYDAASGSFIKRSIVADDYTPPAGDWIEGLVDHDANYVAGGVITARAAGAISASKSLIQNNGIDSSVVTCPNPCWLRVNGAFVQANGTYAVTATVTGSVLVRLAGQYRGEVSVVVGDDLDLAFEADPRWIALKNATSAQIDTWLTSNVTNIAQARTVLKVLLLAIRRVNR